MTTSGVGTRSVLRVGIGGLGVGATAMMAEAAAHPRVKIVAGADPRPEAREKFASQFGAETYRTLEDMCESPNVDLVYVMTPNRMHAGHAVVAAEHGKQVLLDKPMGLTLAECDAVIQAADRNGVRVLVGHTQSLDPANLRMAEIVRTGELGRPLMINTWFYSDWFYRPRCPEELDPSLGEGLVMRQGPVQVDMVRMLGGGMARGVRASTTAIHPDRPIEGAYMAYVEFENGASASLTYNAYAHFDSTELTWGLGLRGRVVDPDTNLKSRRQMASLSKEQENAYKDSTRYGNPRASGGVITGEGAMRHAFFGITLVSCERGDVRQTPEGIMIYGDDKHWEERIPAGDGYSRRYTTVELDAMYDAWSRDAPLTLHDARWAKGTTEICLGILQSARDRREIPLAHQTPYRGAGAVM